MNVKRLFVDYVRAPLPVWGLEEIVSIDLILIRERLNRVINFWDFVPMFFVKTMEIGALHEMHAIHDKQPDPFVRLEKGSEGPDS